MADQTTMNDALAKAVHDLVNARPNSVRGRIVYVLDDIDDETMRRSTEASGVVSAEFMSQFVMAVIEHFANVFTENGMPPHVAAISLMAAAKQGIDEALGNEDEGDGDAAVELADAASSFIQ